jgi:hypothetical protein
MPKLKGMNTTPHATVRVKNAKDLTKEPPRSPRQRLGGYVIMGRTIDKGRADIAGKMGEYHFDCPLDKMFFQFKGINSADFKRALKDGLTDEEMVQWVSDHGTSRNEKEIQGWSDTMEQATLLNEPEKREYFIAECKKLGLNPQVTSLFDWLEADDRAMFSRKNKPLPTR